MQSWSITNKPKAGLHHNLHYCRVLSQGQLLNLALTPGNVDDRKPVPALVQQLFGKLVADRGYLSKALSKQLRAVPHGTIKRSRVSLRVNTTSLVTSLYRYMPLAHGATRVVAAIPAEAVVAGLLWPLLQDRHPLPVQREYFHVRRTGGGQEVGKNRLAVKWIGRVLRQLRAIGQGHPLATPKKV